MTIPTDIFLNRAWCIADDFELFLSTNRLNLVRQDIHERGAAIVCKERFFNSQNLRLEISD